MKEVTATGYMDLDGVTATGKIDQVILSGGLIEKSSSYTGIHGQVQSKLILGDKYGNLHLLDISRKIVLDKMEIERYAGRRICCISTASLEWVDTKLIYAAVAARGSPIVTIVVLKHNENKMYQLYTINTCPELDNSDALETNEG